MKALIIDDERLARYELRRLLLAHPEVVVIGEAANMRDGLEAIAELAPDLIFLDVQMPGGSGFDLLAALDAPPAVIFTTAFDTYAIKAFDVSALDYLLKPIEPPRLAHALLKYQRQSDAPKERPAGADGKVFIKDGERCWFVAMEQIVLFESEGNYTRVYFDNNRPLLLRSLNQLEAKLDPDSFMRVSRRQIVNLKFVVDIAPGPAGGMVMTLKDDIKVPMSRRRAAEFKQVNRL
ncbi:LytR/AlgR family response regulator transcription factor [Massilia glaciei]|uniref:DNA-binding response regulator n=1 Tax=Massilia glaciei TaxID=1524097 RepID=A0A2U2HGQ8_9BURK|nr:LytTR family DNA-binding domain-containing protein [Massilia glaciei]PWF44370.1 DNA-binding response regulator [Massilia glaciei]